MQRQGIIGLIGVFLLGLSVLFARLFGTLDLSITYTPTLDQSSVATLASLMLRGTLDARFATQIASPSTPTPEFSVVSGKICYPSGKIPPMTAYFRNTTTGTLFELAIKENQDTYSVQLTNGQYLAWAYASQYQVGGLYSKAVVCGLKAECTDHAPLLFNVAPGSQVNGIDLCDWVVPVPTLEKP